MENIKKIVGQSFSERGKAGNIYPMICDSNAAWRMKNRSGVFYGRFVLSGDCLVNIKMKGEEMQIDKDFTSQILFEELLSISGLARKKNEWFELLENSLFAENNILEVCFGTNLENVTEFSFNDLSVNPLDTFTPVDKTGIQTTLLGNKINVKKLPLSGALQSIWIDSENNLYDYIAAVEGEDIETTENLKVAQLKVSTNVNEFFHVSCAGVGSPVFVSSVPSMVSIGQLTNEVGAKLVYNNGTIELLEPVTELTDLIFDSSTNIFEFIPASGGGSALVDENQKQTYIEFETEAGAIYKFEKSGFALILSKLEGNYFQIVASLPLSLGLNYGYNVRSIPSQAVYFDDLMNELSKDETYSTTTRFPLASLVFPLGSDLNYVNVKIKTVGGFLNFEFPNGDWDAYGLLPELFLYETYEVNIVRDFVTNAEAIANLKTLFQFDEAHDQIIWLGAVDSEGRMITVLSETVTANVPTLVKKLCPIAFTDFSTYFQKTRLIHAWIYHPTVGYGATGLKYFLSYDNGVQFYSGTFLNENGLVLNHADFVDQSIAYDLTILPNTIMEFEGFGIDQANGIEFAFSQDLTLYSSANITPFRFFDLGQLAINLAVFDTAVYNRAVISVEKLAVGYKVLLKDFNGVLIDSILKIERFQTKNGLNGKFSLTLSNLPVSPNETYILDSNKAVYNVTYQITPDSGIVGFTYTDTVLGLIPLSMSGRVVGAENWITVDNFVNGSVVLYDGLLDTLEHVIGHFTFQFSQALVDSISLQIVNGGYTAYINEFMQYCEFSQPAGVYTFNPIVSLNPVFENSLVENWSPSGSFEPVYLVENQEIQSGVYTYEINPLEISQPEFIPIVIKKAVISDGSAAVYTVQTETSIKTVGGSPEIITPRMQVIEKPVFQFNGFYIDFE
jgi:hypothetical protein